MPEKMAETADLADTDGLDEFLVAYIEAALWSSTDNADDGRGEPLDKHYTVNDIAPETLTKMRADCMEFLAHKLGGRLIAVAERLEAEGRWSLPAGASCSVMAYAGHDLWLTRNGHGAGFWDGNWPRGIADGLDKLAKRFGPYDLCVGDDELIHGA